MNLLKKIKEIFTIIPPKKLLTFLFFLTSTIGYVIAAYFPYAASQIIKFITENLKYNALLYTLYLAIAYITYELLWYLNYYIYSKLQVYYSKTIHNKFFDKIINSSQKFTKKIDKGKMLSLVNADIPNYCFLIDSTVSYLSAIIMVFISSFLIFKANVLTGIIAMLSTIFYLLFITKTTTLFAKYLKAEKKQNDYTNNIYLEELTGLKEIKTLPIRTKLEQQLNSKLKNFTQAFTKKRKYYEHNENTSDLIPHYTKFLLYLILIIYLAKYNATLDLIILIIGYYDQIVESLNEMLQSYTEIEQYYVSVERIKDVLYFDDKLSLLYGNYEEDNIFGSIVFKNVTYETKEKLYFNNINFEIKPHTLNVIVGKSGSGKSELFNLLLRFQKLTSGDIFLDGKNIYTYSDSIYSSNITLVKQEPFFYNMSILNNLKLVTKNKENIITACQKVGIHEFIMSLPKKYNTELNQNAYNLSDGQKQLLSIARALLTDAEIFLMDNITSSLDQKTNNEIVSLLKKLSQDHTILVITNRDDLIAAADQILCLDNKVIKSYSSFSELQEKYSYEDKGEEK